MLATTARACFTRPRRSWSLRPASFSSASRESSGNPLVVSMTVNRRVGVGISSGSSTEGVAIRDSMHDRDPSRGRRVVSRVGTAIGPGAGPGVAGFGAAGPFGGGSVIRKSMRREYRSLFSVRKPRVIQTVPR